MADNEYPDVPEIESRLKSAWSDRDAMIEEMRELRFMDNTPDVPALMDAETVQTPLCYQLVERMVGTLTADPIRITVPPAANTDRARRQSSDAELWTTAMLRQLQRQADEDVIERFVECLIADGHGCMRMLYAPQAWGGYPRRKKGEADTEYTARVESWKRTKPIPINWTWVDPINVYPLWGEMGLEAVLEVDQRDPLALHPERYNMVKENPELWDLARRPQGESGRFKFAQLWTREALTYAVNDQVVHHEKHKYAQVPYVYKMGSTVSTSDVARMGLSMLYPLRSIAPQLDRLLSQKASAVRLWCWPTPIFKAAIASILPDEGTAGQQRTIEVKPGEAVTLYEGEELGFLVMQGTGPDIDNMISLLLNFAERAGLSDSMFGINPGGDSGYAINQLISAARMKFKPIVAHAQRGMEQIVSTLWDILEYQLRQPLYVYAKADNRGWIGLDPDDLAGYRQVDVTLNPLLPTDTYAKSSQAINEVRAGLRSIASAMEEIGIEHPDKEMDNILLDKFKASPEVQKILVEAAAKKMGLREIVERQVPLNKLLEIMPTLPPALQQAIQQVLMGQQGMPSAGMPGQMMQQPQGPQVQGMPNAAVMAAPGVQAAPGPPSPGPAAIPRAGPITRPSGIATGQEPGATQVGIEGR